VRKRVKNTFSFFFSFFFFSGCLVCEGTQACHLLVAAEQILDGVLPKGDNVAQKRDLRSVVRRRLPWSKAEGMGGSRVSDCGAAGDGSGKMETRSMLACWPHASHCQRHSHTHIHVKAWLRKLGTRGLLLALLSPLGAPCKSMAEREKSRVGGEAHPATYILRPHQRPLGLQQREERDHCTGQCHRRRHMPAKHLHGA
jgi:hypothetical protein